jgi:hypothetical protein
MSCHVLGIQDNELSCVRDIVFACFYDFSIAFRIVPTVWYFRIVPTVWYFFYFVLVFVTYQFSWVPPN